MAPRFASAPLNLANDANRKIMVSKLFQTRRLRFLPWIEVEAGWRIWALQRASMSLVKAYLVAYTYFIPILIWWTIRGSAKALKLVGIGKGTFLQSDLIRSFFMLVALRILMRNKVRADLFWYLYFICAQSLDDYILDYCEAWRIQPENDRELMMFVDNDHRQLIPCSKDAEDKELLEHLRCFYELTLARGGITTFLGLRASSRIEIVKVENGFAVGDPIDQPLDLGRHGIYNRQIYYFMKPHELEGHTIRERLVTECVMIAPGTQQPPTNQQQAPGTPQHGSVSLTSPSASSIQSSVNPDQGPGSPNPNSQHVNSTNPSANQTQQQDNPDQPEISPKTEERRALNVVRMWNPHSATVIVLFPFVLGTLISVIWPIVATSRYKADVQTSTQTGFTVGTFVVTAGALLVALVAFLDTKSQARK